MQPRDSPRLQILARPEDRVGVVGSVFVGPDDDPEAVMAFVYEVIGYLLVPSVYFKKAFLLLGEGDSGKSTFMKLLRQILGDEHVSSHTLRGMSERYATATMFGKLANLGGDLSSFAGEDVETFMSVVGRDEIQARQIYGVPFKYTPFVKLVFGANRYPWTPNQHSAYFNRFIVVRNELDPQHSRGDGTRVMPAQSVASSASRVVRVAWDRRGR
jgi:phage/plasmid-associated DNA primase